MSDIIELTREDLAKHCENKAADKVEIYDFKSSKMSFNDACQASFIVFKDNGVDYVLKQRSI